MKSVAVIVLMALAAGCTIGADTLPPASPSREEAILLARPLPNLVFEIDFIEASPPPQFALDSLAVVARELTLKESVTLLPPTRIDPELARRTNESWSIEEIHAVHDATFDLGPGDALGNETAAFVHVIFLDSQLRYEYRGEWRDAAGLSSRNVIYVFYEDELFSAGGMSAPYPPGVPSIGGAERVAGILVHEFGHAMGLVDNGVPMVRTHNDPEDPAHSGNPDSIMSGGWDIVDESKAKVLRGDSPTLWFDDDDRADLAAFQDAHRPSST